jgi:ABC-type branched-subunit amino acid transport system substrate-binding protein
VTASGLVRALLALTFVLAACTSDDGDGLGIPQQTPRGRPSSSDTLVIGLVGTMTGDDAWRGEDAFEGADLGVHRLNVAQVEDEAPFELVTRDDGGSAAMAVRQIEELVALPRTVGIVYAGPPDALPRVEDALAKRGVPAMLVYGDLYGARRLTPHIFQMSPSLVWEARRIAAYAVDDRRYESVGVLAGKTPTSAGAIDVIRDALGNAGGVRVPVARYEADLNDVERALERLRNARTEAVVVEGPPRAVSAVAAALRRMRAGYISTARARLASARADVRRRRVAAGAWHPQVVVFDAGLSPRVEESLDAGTVASDSYGRGVHYLPVPAFRRFRQSFRAWWGALPLGWQLRAYDAVRLIGWASDRAEPGEDLARVLEEARTRFGGTEVTLGPDDHTAVDQSAVGLWVVPAPGREVPERDRLSPELVAAFPWVPLARGWSIDGVELDFSSRDWRYLVSRSPPPQAPPPRISRLEWGVATRRSDPIH